MPKRKIAALEKVEADLPALQDKIRRDPTSYRQDFANQYGQYVSIKEILLQSPTTTGDNGVVSLRNLIDFVAHVADCYPDLTADFPKDLINLIELHHASLDPELRDKIVGSIVLLRKKEIVDSNTLLNTLWKLLLSTPSKALRALCFQKIVSDLRTANSKTKNHKLNRNIQTICYNAIADDPASPKGLWAVKLTRELWKRQVWADAKAVSVMEIAALSQDSKVVTSGVRFFLGSDQEREQAAEESDDESDVDVAKIKHQVGINKKSTKRNKEIKAAQAKVKRKEKRKNTHQTLNFSALHLLHDPQGFAEKLFQQHLQPAQPKVRLVLEQKLFVLQLVSRLTGLHKLTIIPLYSYFIRFLSPKQPSVTSFLANLAQATHSLVPPDVLEPLVQKIANEFVSEAAASEVASAGLNGIREICVRQPLAMTETLLQDLVQYRKSKDKGVQMAARGLLSLYRDVGAQMLKKKDRGRDAALKLRVGENQGPRFGEVDGGGIEGIELLEKWREEQGIDSDDDEEAWKNWDAQSDDSESDGGWINVESEGEDIEISDSEDDKPAGKKAKAGSKDSDKENKNEQDADEGDDVDEAKSRQTASLEPEAALKREEARMSKLATTRILTPADLEKLKELRQTAAITAAMPTAKRRKLQQQQEAARSNRHADDEVTAEQIAGLAKYGEKLTKEEKIRMAKGDKEDGNDHRSTTARRKEKKEAEGKSTTNKEKARKKNFMMTLGKAKRKGKRSLVEHRRILKAHVDRGKRGGRRGNN
ncbi:hypothetical protein CLAFUW4_02812 [Fulvia fulva]|uniref:Protein SDA1 n=1 Tax=Passalora fulva TaxID=5499 RepID=A0A9Q8LB55_PASFU|nr:uncharacterized protein CLAFUR5_02799 [Fulvia fulva]KAK4631635.1 hypothetical protein CLAFUR4_02806 [Fulvia fulva]KAK4633338.1 hypothetical protein CLAFUR0_02808 [Fulvia fulva]UJO14193.1 hypothetical protein CLAFUR5_02799 [Fulvia fulva]WPV11766.1 hypothetical protein CLAFUW4_02812 [Fulvia fulva]WPV26625.1 hypothetical protein CLAFUW7_02810 [Fulvia fulva]